MVRFLPSLLTVAGLVLGIAGVVEGSIVMLFGSLALDVADGRLARALDVASVFGADLDWHVDVALSHVIACVWLTPLLVLPLVVLQVGARSQLLRCSGRAAVTVAALIWGIR